MYLPGGFYPSKDLERLEKLGITHIVNLSSYDNEFPTTFTYMRIEVDDFPDQEIYSYLGNAVNFVESGLKNGKVLVHCNAGQSRAGSIIAAYLMKSQKITLDSALELARSKRKKNKVLPNSGFMKQLRQFEKEIRSSSINKVDVVFKG